MYETAFAYYPEAKKLEAINKLNSAQNIASVADEVIEIFGLSHGTLYTGGNKAEIYKAIEINPKEANAYILAGNMYSNLKKFKEAEAEYKEALKINKLDPSIFVLIANVYYMNNEIERSIYSYRAAVNMRPENDEYKLVFIQVLDDFISEYRKDDIVAAF